MSAYTSGNKAPTLMAQAPNRVGNKSKYTPGPGGVTAITRPQGSTAYSGPHQGPAKTGADPTKGRGQKVTVNTCHCDDVTPRNDAYMNKSVKNYLG